MPSSENCMTSISKMIPIRSTADGTTRERYFSTDAFHWTAEGIRKLILLNLTWLACRLYGKRFVRHEYVPRGEVLPAVKSLAEKTSQGTPAMLSCGPSGAVRACLYAREHGIDISGTIFRMAGEALVLPARFGGAINDYQLVEDEETGLRRVSGVVSPRVGAIDEETLVATVLNGLRTSHREGGELMTEQWRQVGTLRVVRREPHATRTSKVPPLHIVRNGSAEQAAKVPRDRWRGEKKAAKRTIS